MGWGWYTWHAANVNFANKVYPLAISEYEKALKADTASKEVYYRWAEACLELKDYPCALEKLSVVLTKDSMHAEAWMKAGGIYYKAARSTRDPQEFKKRFIETIGSYEKYIELSQAEPDSFTGRAYYETAMSYVFIGGYAKAQEYFRTVLSIPVEPRDIYFYFARSFQGNRENPQYDSALYYYEKHKEWVSQQDTDYETGISDTELYRRMGECYESTKDWFNTINYYKKSLEYDSTQARLLYGVAVAYNYTGDYMNALIYYMKRIALGVDERYWSIYYNAATSALYLLDKGGIAMMEEEDLEEDDDAELDIEEPANPLEGVDLARLAVEYLEKITNDYWEIVSSKENYLKTGIKALGMLGSTYLYQLNDCTNGVKNYQRVLEYEPENCEALKSLGYAYFGGICTNNYTRALDYLGKAKSCYKKAGKVECDQEMVDLELWIAQTYQFRAIDRREAKQKEASKP
jgi:tetratricopeptide (TPR) repeat protein